MIPQDIIEKAAGRTTVAYLARRSIRQQLYAKTEIYLETMVTGLRHRQDGSGYCVLRDLCAAELWRRRS